MTTKHEYFEQRRAAESASNCLHHAIGQLQKLRVRNDARIILESVEGVARLTALLHADIGKDFLAEHGEESPPTGEQRHGTTNT